MNFPYHRLESQANGFFFWLGKDGRISSHLSLTLRKPRSKLENLVSVRQRNLRDKVKERESSHSKMGKGLLPKMLTPLTDMSCAYHPSERFSQWSRLLLLRGCSLKILILLDLVEDVTAAIRMRAVTMATLCVNCITSANWKMTQRGI